MNTEPLKIQVKDVYSVKLLQALRNGIADRRALHVDLAVDAQAYTRAYVRQLDRHTTAKKLGASPTNFHQRNANVIESKSDATSSVVRMPRSTGLGRAFRAVTIRPGPGRTYLTLPGCAETYGKGVRDFPAETFAFTMLGGRHPALIWRQAGGSHEAGSVAYWLKREVNQKQDRTLLPSDEGFQELAVRRIQTYVADLIKPGA